MATYNTHISNTGVLVLDDNDLISVGYYSGKGAGLANTGTATIIGATFSGNTALQTGGALRNYASTAIITATNTLFDSNTASHGCFLQLDDGTVTIVGSTITNNISPNSGGAIRIERDATQGNLTLTDTYMANNSGNNGGMIYIEATTVSGTVTVTISGSTFANNISKAAGGIYTSNADDRIYITNSVFDHNVANGSAGGGVMFLSKGQATVTNTKFFGNTANSGAAIGMANGARLHISGSTFSGNYSTTSGVVRMPTNGTLVIEDSIFDDNTGTGGAAVFANGTSTISGSTFSGNSVASAYGVIQLKDGKMSISNSLITGNKAAGTSIYSGVSMEGDSSLLTISGSTFTGNSGGVTGVNSLHGTTTVSDTVFDGNTGSAPFYIYANDNKTTIFNLENSSVTNNFSDNGAGAISVNKPGSTVNVSGTYISGNTTGTSGGLISMIYIGGTLNINDSIIEGNTSTSSGIVSGIKMTAKSAILNVTGSTFSNNWGGNTGLYNEHGTATITNSLFDGNKGPSACISTYANDNSVTLLTISGSTITNNTNTDSFGCAIYVAKPGSTVNIINTLIEGNTGTSNNYGTGLCAGNGNVAGGLVNVIGSTFANNSGFQWGKDIYNWRGQMNISGSYFLTPVSDSIFNRGTITFAGTNTFAGGVQFRASEGGAYYLDDATMVFINNIAITVGDTTNSSLNAFNFVEGSSNTFVFNNTGKVTFTKMDLSETSVATNQTTNGTYTLAGGITAMAPSITLNGTNAAFSSGQAAAIAADGLTVAVANYASNNLSVSVSDTIYIAMGEADNFTHFDTMADMEAFYGGTTFRGTVFNAADKQDLYFVNTAWTRDNLPATATLVDGSTVALTWATNAYNDVTVAKALTNDDGTIYVYDAAISSTLRTFSDVNFVLVNPSFSATPGALTHTGTGTLLIKDGQFFNATSRPLNNDTSGLAEIVGCTISGNSVNTQGVVSNSGLLGVTSTIFDGNTATHGSAIRNAPGPENTVTIVNSIIRNGVVPNSGGALRNENGYIYVNNSIVENNIGNSGAAYYGETNSKLFVNGSTFTANTANANAAIGLGQSTATIVNTLFLNNVAKSGSSNGGAIYTTRACRVEVSGSTFTANTANRRGGAIYLDGATTVTVSNSTFNNNLATGVNGGAIVNDSNSTITLNYVVFNANTAGDSGGAITNSGRLTVNNAVADGNQAASYGGFLYNNGGVAEISDSTITNSRAGASGGAIRLANNATVTVQDSIFDGGANPNGTGIGVYDSTATISGSTFSNNQARETGGALLVSGTASSLEVTTSLFEGNCGTAHAGAIMVENYGGTQAPKPVTISGSTFTDNTTGGNGGGIYMMSNVTVSVSNSSFRSNYADSGAGIYVASGSTATITNVLLDGNTATGQGGAFYNAGRLTITGSTISRNRAGTSGFLYVASGLAEIYNTTVSENTSGNAGGGIRAISGSTVNIYNSHFNGNYGSNGGLATIYTTVKFEGSTFSANTANGNGGVMYLGNNGRVIVKDSYFEGNIARSQGGAITTVREEAADTVIVEDSNFVNNVGRDNGGAIYLARASMTTASISGSTFTGNTANVGAAVGFANVRNVQIANSLFENNIGGQYGGAIYLAGTASANVSGSTFSGNSSGNHSGAIYNPAGSSITIENSQFLTVSDAILIRGDATISGNITTAAEIVVDNVASDSDRNGVLTADGVNLTLINTEDINIGTITVVNDGVSAVNFQNTGKVTFRSLDLSAANITINHSDAPGEYTLATGLAGLNTNIILNNTAVTMTDGVAYSVSSDGMKAECLNYASNTLTFSVYDKLYVGFDVPEDAIHFDSIANLQATYVGYSGTIIDASSVTKLDEVFFNSSWTSDNLPTTTTLADGTSVALVWEENAFNSLNIAKNYLADDGIMTFEGVVPTTAQTADFDKVRVHNASISGNFTSGNTALILDDFTMSGQQIFITGSGTDENLTIKNYVNGDRMFYAGYTRREGDFNFNVSGSTVNRFYICNSGNGGTVNFNIENSVLINSGTNSGRIALTTGSGPFNDVNVNVTSTRVSGGVWGTGSASSVNILGDVTVTLTGSTAGHIYGSAGNTVQGDVLITLTGSSVGAIYGEDTPGAVAGSIDLNVTGNTASTVGTAIASLDTITIADDATLALGSVTITDSAFAITADNNGAITVLADSTVTLAGSVTLAKDFTLGANAAIVAANDAVITITATGTFSNAIATGTGNALVIDNAAALTLTTNVSGFGDITFAGDAAVALGSQSLAGKTITIDTNNVWTNGVTTIATGISGVDGATFTVNGLAATLGTAMANGAVLDFADGTLTLTVTAVEVGGSTSLDDALEATAATSGIITFAAETDGTTCTFSGNTIGHDQDFQGNGSDQTTIKSADASMVFANGNEIGLNSLAWEGIIYGGNLNGDSASTSLSFQDASIGGNVFGGGRANAGSDVSMGDVSLSLADSTQVAGKAVYGGGYANGGTASIDSVSLVLDNVDGGTNSVYGGGAVNGGGSLEVGSVTTEINGGVHGAIYNGANIYTSGTGSAFIAGTMELDINGGTFTGAVGNGSTPRDGASSTQGASTLNISGGVFQGIVYGGAASFGTATTNATVASTTVTISGGTFNGKVFGGNVGQTGAKAANTSLTGTANLTIDSSEANIYFNNNVFGGSMGAGRVGGKVTVTFTGDGSNLHFGASSFVSGDSEYAYGVTSYVGSKELVFDNFSGGSGFAGNIQGPAFDTVTIKNGAQLRCRYAGTNQDFSFVSTWNFELASASAVMTTDENNSGLVKNSFYGDTINITFADGAADVVAGTDWTVYQGKEATISDWNSLSAVTIDGVDATGAMEGDYMVWSTNDYKVYIDNVSSGNRRYDICLAARA